MAQVLSGPPIGPIDYGPGRRIFSARCIYLFPEGGGGHAMRVAHTPPLFSALFQLYIVAQIPTKLLSTWPRVEGQEFVSA